ncbi:MAG TPA: DegT/DnrJ/EryC1/StrS family aminotransferase [Vicinamibacterales bacterium]|nr:DegT/DnrJ/EryC1/StrS family aminotransferase [Vicinamibacterales bacterium]
MNNTTALIPVARPWLDERDAEAARRAILSGWVTQGPEVAAFEREFAAAVGAPLACAVSSCTTALHLALLALGIGPGDEVITVSHSFIATANAVRYCNATPVFVDVTADTFNIDPSLIEPAISDRTKAILIVHQLGMPCELPPILALAKRRGIPVIEDAACAIGSELLWDRRWERIGRPHADIACFSFHPRKLLSTGDGGMLTTRDEKLDATFRLLRQHGMTVPDTVRHASSRVVFEEYSVPAYNYRMTDIQAAIGREQLKRLPAIVDRRRTLAAAYAESLRGIPGVIPATEPAWARTNWQSYTVRLQPPLDQRRVMQQLLDEGISTRRGVMNAHREPAYPAGSWRAAGSLTRGEHAQDTVIVLPLYHQMTDEDQQRVVAALRRAVSPALSAALR